MPRGPKPTLHLSAEAMAASLERDRERAPHATRTRSVWETWWCSNPHCDGFTDRGSFAMQRCTRCGTPRPVGA